MKITLRKRLQGHLSTAMVLMLLGVFGASPLFAQHVVDDIFGGRRLDWDYDDNRILGHIGNDVYLWNAKDGSVLQRLIGHGERIYSVRFGPGLKYAFTTSWRPGGGEVSGDPLNQSKDTSVRMWDLESGNQVHRFDDQVIGAISPDGSRLLTFSISAKNSPKANISMWSILSGRLLFVVKPDDSTRSLTDAANYGQLTFSPDGSEFVLSNNSELVLFDSNSGVEIGKIPLWELIGDMRGERLHVSLGIVSAINPRANQLEVWDLRAGQRLRSESLPDGQLGWFWTHDGKRLVGVATDKKVQIWQPESGGLVTGADCDCTFPARALANADDSRFLLMIGGGQRKTQFLPPQLGLYSTETGQQIARITLRKTVLIGFSPDGATFLVGGSTFEIYSSVSGEKLVSLDLLKDRVASGFQ